MLLVQRVCESSAAWHIVSNGEAQALVVYSSSGACVVIADTLVVAAPKALTAQTRVDFRRAALECLERSSRVGSSALTIDMSATQVVDACGLGVLVLVTKRARGLGIVTRLLRAHEDVRSLLSMTHLEPLFQFRSE
ncbi:MAG: STAS domain-containing protein [Gemmatimonadaceae bacterium]